MPHKIVIVSNDNQPSEQVITVGNGTSERTTMFGSQQVMICNKENAVLKDVAYSPQMKFNLCSLSKLMKEGWWMEGDKNGIKMNKDGKVLEFDIKISTTTGLVFCMYLKRTSELVQVLTNWSLNEAHEWLGHANEDATRATAN